VVLDGCVLKKWKKEKKSPKSIYQFDTATVATLEGLSLYTHNETFTSPLDSHTHTSIATWSLLTQRWGDDYYAERATKDLMNHEVGKKIIYKRFQWTVCTYDILPALKSNSGLQS